MTTSKQRNNAIIDIAWGILTSPHVTDQTKKGGNFDECKRVANIFDILTYKFNLHTLSQP